MKTLEKKFNILKVANVTCGYGFKLAVLLLFSFLFIGVINPARISTKLSNNVSLVKTAFYFKGSTQALVNLEKTDESESQDNPFDSIEESGSYDDFYAAFAAMVEASSSEEEVDYEDDFDDDSELSFNKAEKITVVKYKEVWNSFAQKHSEIAEALEFNRTAALLTFFAVILCVVGLFLACGTNIIRKIGYIIACAGSVLVMISLTNFNVSYGMLNSAMDMLEVEAIPPAGITVFIIVSLFILAFGITQIILEKSNKEEKSKLSVIPFQYTFRVLALLLFILLFIPGANPARISESINRNVSLFTAGFSYTTYTENLQRALIRGWLPESVTRIAWISSLFACFGILACGTGSCMSIGNNKLKRLGYICLLSGSVVSFVSLFGILHSYNLISSSPNIDRLEPLEPNAVGLYFVLLILIFVCSLVSFLLTPAPEKEDKYSIEAPYQLFLMILPFLILVFIFSYLPLWGWRYAFFDYNAGDVLSMDAWVGFKWFKAPFENEATRADIVRVLRNTLAMSGLGILGSWLPMVFAIFLAEIKNTKARKVIQTLTTIPNFISWVLVYAIAFCIFGTQGFISSLMVNSGIWDKGKNMLMGDSGIWFKMWLWGTWKGLGWSAIMYIAAISGIDQQLYEAATVDGAGRFQKIWHITIPELLPTYLVLLILSVSNILSNGMDQYLCFKNPTNKGPIEVLDLYVYQLTFGSTSNSNIPFSTVVSMFKSLVSVVLLFVTNKISKWIRGTSIF